MSLAEMPTLLASSYASTNYDASELLAKAQNWNRAAAAPDLNNAVLRMQAAQQHQFQPKGEPTMANRRLVQVFIADPDENVPLADSLLYSGEQKLTDLTDQELFFEIDIRSILASHNEKRAKLVNKKVKERTEYLEPARIRDLKMTVVSVATF